MGLEEGLESAAAAGARTGSGAVERQLPASDLIKDIFDLVKSYATPNHTGTLAGVGDGCETVIESISGKQRIMVRYDNGSVMITRQPNGRLDFVIGEMPENYANPVAYLEALMAGIQHQNNAQQ